MGSLAQPIGRVLVLLSLALGIQSDVASPWCGSHETEWRTERGRHVSTGPLRDDGTQFAVLNDRTYTEESCKQACVQTGYQSSALQCHSVNLDAESGVCTLLAVTADAGGYLLVSRKPSTVYYQPRCSHWAERPGWCPKVRGTDKGTCEQSCFNDADCPGKDGEGPGADKCCNNGCGWVCIQPRDSTGLGVYSGGETVGVSVAMVIVASLYGLITQRIRH